MMADSGPALTYVTSQSAGGTILRSASASVPKHTLLPQESPWGSAPVQTCFQPHRLLSEERKGLREASTQEG